jgi:hypothetical protein
MRRNSGALLSLAVVMSMKYDKQLWHDDALQDLDHHLPSTFGQAGRAHVPDLVFTCHNSYLTSQFRPSVWSTVFRGDAVPARRQAPRGSAQRLRDTYRTRRGHSPTRSTPPDRAHGAATVWDPGHSSSGVYSGSGSSGCSGNRRLNSASMPSARSARPSRFNSWIRRRQSSGGRASYSFSSPASSGAARSSGRLCRRDAGPCWTEGAGAGAARGAVASAPSAAGALSRCVV